ncbi:alpha/beta fold hydrolase [Amnibacterium flavum]|uniref:Alpha/beta hydrolase n=1 Tax=Amnibacterium flavum TaxID=2173173 RepID=A0A2V1HWC9_9MICO|nr:alpha/beta fold hydrolase [Amnibacterium flavum]PVZ94494.1 alpha/beta hydrolase [Amnibacterium flavum]
MTTVPDEYELRDRRLPDIDWATPPAGSAVSTFDAPSGPLAVLSMGDPSAPRVVLVPGVTGSKEDFHFQFSELAAAGFLVQSYDLAGQYESWQAGPERLSPPRAEYDYDLFVDDMIAFLEAGRTPAHLVGYSFAGIVAQLVVARRPELVSSLTLLSTPPLAGDSFRGVRWLGAFSRLGSREAIAGFMRWGIDANTQHVPSGRLAFVRERFSLTRTDAHEQVVGLMQAVPDLVEQLRAAPIPKAVAVGSHDLWPLRLHRRFASGIGASIAVYRTGHSPCETAPYQLSRDLLSLFDKALQTG